MNIEQFENLLAEYWDIAYEEGKTGKPNGVNANRVLRELKAALAAQAQQTESKILSFDDNGQLVDKSQAQQESCIECAGTGKKVIHDSFITVCDSCRGSGKEASQAQQKCRCVYATARNTPSVKAGYEMGGYVKSVCDYCQQQAQQESQVIGEMRENGVNWYGKNPHAFAVGTKFFALPPAPVSDNEQPEGGKE